MASNRLYPDSVGGVPRSTFFQYIDDDNTLVNVRFTTRLGFLLQAQQSVCTQQFHDFNLGGHICMTLKA